MKAADPSVLPVDRVWLVFGQTPSGDELSGVFGDADSAVAYAEQVATRYESGVKYTTVPVPLRATDNTVELRME